MPLDTTPEVILSRSTRDIPSARCRELRTPGVILSRSARDIPLDVTSWERLKLHCPALPFIQLNGTAAQQMLVHRANKAEVMTYPGAINGNIFSRCHSLSRGH